MGENRGCEGVGCGNEIHAVYNDDADSKVRVCDDYYFEQGGARCYIVRQSGSKYQVCENLISTRQGFDDFFRMHSDGEWTIVADLVVAESEGEAIDKIKRINMAALLSALLCVINVISIICNPMEFYNFVILFIAIVTYICVHFFLLAMRSTQLKYLLGIFSLSA
ncbi:hypothetical protein ACEUAY_16785 [Aeromonas veronii]